MRLCTNRYTGTSGLYAHVTPDANTLKYITSFLRQTQPPFLIDEYMPRHVTVMCSERCLSTARRLPCPKEQIEVQVDGVEYCCNRNPYRSVVGSPHRKSTKQKEKCLVIYFILRSVTCKRSQT
jgi:hypothetical protein